MKAVMVSEIGSFAVTEIDIPKPTSDQVLLHVNVTGLCRKNLKNILATILQSYSIYEKLLQRIRPRRES